jgi:hypothetical protein
MVNQAATDGEIPGDAWYIRAILKAMRIRGETRKEKGCAHVRAQPD